MQILDVEDLSAGSVFAAPLFHRSGQKLLPNETELTQPHIEALRRSGIQQVFMAENARPVLALANASPRTVNVRELVIGQAAETDLMTPDGVVIIRQNEAVEEHHVAACRDSGVDFLIAQAAADMDSIRAVLEDLGRIVIGRHAALIKRGEHLRAPEVQDSLLSTIAFPPATEVLNLNAIQLLRRRLSSRLQPVFGLLETGKQPNLEALQDITGDLLDLMRSEPRQFSQLALMTSRREDYLPDHAISVAVLSMAIAAHMNLSLEMVKEVVLGALLFDVGMLMVPRRIRLSSGKLGEADRQRVQQHPVYSIGMMEQVAGLTPIPRLMGYQHHERLNGRGYPAKTNGAEISDWARIVAAADIFAASTNPRAYKQQKLPYGAMEELIHLAHQGMLDPRVVKAMLSAVGLFPVGSYVLLSNQMTAQVVGVSAARVDRPLIQPMSAGAAAGAMVDLSRAEYDHIKVMRAVAPPAARAGGRA